MAQVLGSITIGKLAEVEAVISDVDGCLSRRIRLDGEGTEIKVFCEKDAPRVGATVKAGIPFVMISGRDSKAARARAEEMGAAFYWRKALHHEKDSFACLEGILGVERKRTLYIGDDWQDLWWMREALISATPADGVKECRDIAHIVTESRGGEGAISEVLIHLLQAKNLYKDIIANHINTAPRYL